MRIERPFAHCCAEAGGRVEACDCVNKDHGTAFFDVRDDTIDCDHDAHEWVRRAYREPQDLSQLDDFRFTRWNMAVAYQAGKDSAEQSARNQVLEEAAGVAEAQANHAEQLAKEDMTDTRIVVMMASERIATAIRALMSRPASDGWRPIAEAERGKQLLDLWVIYTDWWGRSTGERKVDCRWRNTSATYEEGWHDHYGNRIEWSVDMSLAENEGCDPRNGRRVTHFRPLPTPPSGEEG